MSKAGETQQVGDEAWTPYSGAGMTLVRITGRRENQTDCCPAREVCPHDGKEWSK